MTRRLLISASILALTAGCSSSSSGTTPAADSGTTENDSSMAVDTGTTSDDGGTTDTGTITQGDTGTVNNGDSGTAEAGPPCTAATTVSGLAGYESVSQQSVCTSTQITAAVAACFGSGGSQAKCTAWQTANAACAACAVPPNGADGGAPPNNAGILCIDAVNECFVNVDGCVQIKDGNSTCAAADEQLTACVYTACDSVACVADLQAQSMDYDTCLTAAQNVACSTEATAWTTACGGADSADAGALNACAVSTLTDVSKVLNVICNGNNAQ
jgi:hypothetical protein